MSSTATAIPKMRRIVIPPIRRLAELCVGGRCAASVSGSVWFPRSSVTPALSRGHPRDRLQPMIQRTPCVYILANRHNGALYVGVTSNLIARVMQHREGTFDGHTKKYRIHRLVYFEVANEMEAATSPREAAQALAARLEAQSDRAGEPGVERPCGGAGAGAAGGVTRGAVDLGTRPG